MLKIDRHNLAITLINEIASMKPIMWNNPHLSQKNKDELRELISVFDDMVNYTGDDRSRIEKWESSTENFRKDF